MASSECCEVPGLARSVLGGPGWSIPHFKSPHPYCTVELSSAPIFPVLGSAVRADFFLSGCLGSAVGAGSEETLSSVVPWPWGPPIWVTCVLLAKGLQETGQFPLPVAVILLCRGCSRGKAGSRNFVDSSYSPGAVSS